MYAFSYGPVAYDLHKDGSRVSLIDAMRATYGVAAARVYRILPDGTLRTIVTDAGSAYAVTYIPKGKTIIRRTARHLRQRTCTHGPACPVHPTCDGGCPPR